MDLLQTPLGFVQRRIGRLILPSGQEVVTNDAEQAYMHVLSDDRIVALQAQKVWIIGLNGSVSKVSLPFPMNSLAVVQGEIFVGSDNGAKRITTKGTVEVKFGVGRTHVFSNGGRAVAIDASGDLFDVKGKLIGHLPFSELLSAVEWEGGLAMLARLPDNRIAVGKVDLAPFRWRSLDLPLTATPRFLAQEHGQLFVISPGEVMTVTKPSELSAPSVEAKILAMTDGRDLFKTGSRLAPSEDTVEVVLPPPRLGPWANPSYVVRVNDGSWQEASAGHAGAITASVLGPLDHLSKSFDCRPRIVGVIRNRTAVAVVVALADAGALRRHDGFCRMGTRSLADHTFCQKGSRTGGDCRCADRRIKKGATGARRLFCDVESRDSQSSQWRCRTLRHSRRGSGRRGGPA